jgi:hypothetical protein
VEEFGLGRVQVLRRNLGRQRPAPEGDDAAARIADRKHDAVAKPVIGNGNVVAVDDQSAGLDLGLADALAGQKLLQRVAAVGRIAQPERLLRGRRQAAVAQIGAGLCPVRRLQPLLEEFRRHLHDVVERGALLVACLGLSVPRRHRDAGETRDPLDGLGKAQPLQFGQELEMVAGHAAAEAVVAALLVLAVEAGRFLAMERAAGPVVAARRVGLLSLPRDARADNR